MLQLLYNVDAVSSQLNAVNRHIRVIVMVFCKTMRPFVML